MRHRVISEDWETRTRIVRCRQYDSDDVLDEAWGALHHYAYEEVTFTQTWKHYPATGSRIGDRWKATARWLGRCPLCHRRRIARWRRAHPERARELGREQQRRHRERHRVP